LFHTCNALQAERHQIILTSNKLDFIQSRGIAHRVS
jgi:hypothetical protein